jgi:TRAP-type mannitol/chloroaromatic compound transport system permease small subunit
MRNVKLIFGLVDRANELLAKLFSWSIVLLVLTMTYEVISRYVFGAPTLWSYDVSYFLSSLMIMMGMAYTLRIKGHVNIDIVYSRFSPRARALLDVVFALILFFPLFVLIMAAMIPHVMFSWRIEERSWVGTWLPIIYPYKTWVAVGVGMLLVQGTVEFLRNLYVAITGGERP